MSALRHAVALDEVVLDVAALGAVGWTRSCDLPRRCRYNVARLGCSRLVSRWKPATAPLAEKFLAKCSCPRCSGLLPCSCTDEVDEVLRHEAVCGELEVFVLSFSDAVPNMSLASSL